MNRDEARMLAHRHAEKAEKLLGSSDSTFPDVITADATRSIAHATLALFYQKEAQQ